MYFFEFKTEYLFFSLTYIFIYFFVYRQASPRTVCTRLSHGPGPRSLQAGGLLPGTRPLPRPLRTSLPHLSTSQRCLQVHVRPYWTLDFSYTRLSLFFLYGLAPEISLSILISKRQTQFRVQHINKTPSIIKLSAHRDIVVLPKLTDEGYRITIFRIRAEYPESSADIANTVRAVLLTSDVRMYDEHQIAGDVFIYEVSKDPKSTN